MSTAVTVWERGRLDARVGPRQVLFGRMYEDPSIELGAFRPGSRVFCIASAGCTAMKLAPHHEVVAVDINPVQLAYAERRFDGDPGVRGRAERIMDFMRFFGPLAGWWPSRVRSFLDLDDPAEQMDYWQRELNTWRFRTSIDAFFSVTALRSVYAPRFLDFLPKRLGSVMRGRMERCFERHPNRTNLYARSLLLGELSSEPPPRRQKTFGSCTRMPPTSSRTKRPRASTGSRSRTFWTEPTTPTNKDSVRPSNAQRHRMQSRCSAASAMRTPARQRTMPPMIAPCSGVASS